MLKNKTIDYIKVEDAINVCCTTERKEVDDDSRVWVDRAEVVKKLSRLPVHQHTEGYWHDQYQVDHGSYMMVCSVCEEVVRANHLNYVYCPYCGSKMKW